MLSVKKKQGEGIWSAMEVNVLKQSNQRSCTEKIMFESRPEESDLVGIWGESAKQREQKVSEPCGEGVPVPTD